MITHALRRIASRLRDKRVYVTLELIGLGVLLGALAYALRDVWAEAARLLRHADLGDGDDRDRDRRRLLPRARLAPHPRRDPTIKCRGAERGFAIASVGGDRVVGDPS